MFCAHSILVDLNEQLLCVTLCVEVNASYPNFVFSSNVDFNIRVTVLQSLTLYKSQSSSFRDVRMGSIIPPLLMTKMYIINKILTSAKGPGYFLQWSC